MSTAQELSTISSAEYSAAWRSRRSWTPYLGILTMLILNLSLQGMVTPRLRAIELAVCREYYAVHNPSMIRHGGFVDESSCEIKAIQEEVAWLKSLLQIITHTTDDRPLFMALESVAAEQEPLLATSTTGLLAANAVEEIITQPLTQVRKPANRFHQYWQSLHKSMKETNQLFTSSRVTQYASLGFLATSFGKQLFQPLIQYVSVRFGIPIAKAGFLYTIKAAVLLMLFTVILPAGKWIDRISHQSYNSRLAGASIVLLASGSLLMGLSRYLSMLLPSLVVYTCGFGFSTLIRSITTANAPEIFIARLYSIFAIAEIVGSLTGTWLLAAAFAKGSRKGGLLLGAPFFISAVSSCCGGDWICGTNLYCEAKDGTRVVDVANTTINYDHFSYALNITICSDATVCPKNDYATFDNTTCCDNNEGKVEINFHNNEPLPTAASDLEDYYARAGKTIPTDGNYVTGSPGSTAAVTDTTRSTAPILAPATSTTSSLLSIVTTSTVTPSPNPPSSDLSGGAKAGIAVGAVIGALAVGATIFFFVYRRRRGPKNKSPSQPSFPVEYAAVPREPTSLFRKSELSGVSKPAEMDADEAVHDGKRTHEMPG
ncbi:MAG: hypothetical protein LQ342_003364 [Letrouitia transgressa]|nr:MAG: hypothetical protein LQ342_003364 [Letrouitia transgressa]